MAFAYGQMNMTVTQLAEITPYHFELKCRGFKDASRKNEELYRKLGWIIFAMQADPKASRGTTIDQVWPIAGQPVKEKKFAIDKKQVNKMLDKFRKRQNLK